MLRAVVIGGLILLACVPGALADDEEGGRPPEPYESMEELFDSHSMVPLLLETMDSASIMRTASVMTWSAPNWRDYFPDTVMGYPVGESTPMTEEDLTSLQALLTRPENYLKVHETSSCAPSPAVALEAVGRCGKIQILMDLGCLTVLEFRGELGDTQARVATPIREDLLAIVRKYFPDIEE